MEKEKFDQLKKLETRINALKALKIYFTGILSNQPVSAKIEISIFGEQTAQLRQNIGDAGATRKNYFDDDDGDARFILDAIQNRIDDLETEFLKA